MKIIYFLETIAALGLKVARSIQLNELMKLSEYQRSRSFFDSDFKVEFLTLALYSGERFMASCPSCFFLFTVPCRIVFDWLVGWLFWVERPFETVFQSISGRLQRERRKRRERTDESKNVQTTLTHTYCKCRGPCPTVIQIVGRPDTGSFPSTIAPPNHYKRPCDVAKPS